MATSLGMAGVLVFMVALGEGWQAGWSVGSQLPVGPRMLKVEIPVPCWHLAKRIAT